MKNTCLFALGLLGLGLIANAGDDFEQVKAVVASGGVASGGAFELKTVIGQPTAGRASGGAFDAMIGFLGHTDDLNGSQLIFKDSFEQ